MEVAVRPDIIVSSAAKAGRLVLRFPYDATLVALVKTVPDRRYHPEEKCWSIPGFSLRDLQARAVQARVRVHLTESVAAALEQGQRDRFALKAAKDVQDVDLTLPTATLLYPYQRAGVAFLVEALRRFKGALLADDMGLGKSLQALSLLALAAKLDNVLILCPASIKYVWAAEIEKHYPQFSYTIVGGTPEERKIQWAERSRIKIANYELLLRDATVKVRDWDMVVADECTRIKNYQAKTTRAAKGLNRRYSLGLSGAPVENRLEELHSIFDFVMPGLLGPGWLFVARHCVKNHFGAVVGYRGIDQVRERIGPHYLRRLKAEVLPELPPKVMTDVQLELSKGEWEVYDGIRQQIVEFVETNPHLAVANVLTEILRLKQCADDVRLLGLPQEDGGGTKIKALRDILEAGEGHKIVAFTQFAEMAKLVAGELEGILFYGDMSPEERAAAIQEFQEGAGQLFVSTEAGAYGVTLTAADIVVHIDQPWNPARLRQREDRLHRIGQTSSVQVINLLARRTVDEYVRRIIHRKRELQQKVLGAEDDGVYQTVTKSDLLGLLKAD